MPPPTTTTAADADADTRTAGHDRTYWRATAAERSDPPLLGERDADVVVVGAGIVGLSVALLAVEAGLDVVVLEARQLASGTTGGTTGKVTSQNGTRLRELRGRFGADGARRYTQLTEGGIARLDELVDRYAIACDLEVAPAHLVSLIARRDRVVEEEATASREAGLTVTSDGELPEVSFRVRRSLTVPDQRQVHAVKLVHGLADAVTSAGGAVHADSRVVDVDPAGGSRRWRVRTTRGVVTADDVVLATRLPTHRDTRLIFARTKPVSAVGIAGPVHAAAPVGMYLFKGTRDWSIRGSRLSDGGEHLVAVGMSATTGDRQALRQRGDRLHAWTRDRWPLTDLTHVWMAQDQLAADERPLIGRLWADGVWAATGFGKWGLAAGLGAADLLVAGITGRSDPSDGFFAISRLDPPAAWPTLLRANLRVGALLVGDHLRAGLRHDLDDLAAGDGRVVRRGRHLVAVSRRDDGALDAVSAHCTHLGCLVRWNRQERTWDCGCHGSRFAPDGEVLDAPATASLDQVPLDD
jgi:glycine/D-amino acid oxidase-like deaminating enzyme/nitrite reductase/ring-hydroxylating ferredoxin subunit